MSSGSSPTRREPQLKRVESSELWIHPGKKNSLQTTNAGWCYLEGCGIRFGLISARRSAHLTSGWSLSTICWIGGESDWADSPEHLASGAPPQHAGYPHWEEISEWVIRAEVGGMGKTEFRTRRDLVSALKHALDAHPLHLRLLS